VSGSLQGLSPSLGSTATRAAVSRNSSLVDRLRTERTPFAEGVLAALAWGAAVFAGGAAFAAVAPDPRAADATGTLRVLVIRATWGPMPSAPSDGRRALAQIYARFWNAARDADSGIAGYRVVVDGRPFATTGTRRVFLTKLRSGTHRITIEAVDRAGVRSSSTARITV
jgi:hypothetical protein